jgi:hypothetical protein
MARRGSDIESRLGGLQEDGHRPHLKSEESWASMSAICMPPSYRECSCDQLELQPGPNILVGCVLTCNAVTVKLDIRQSVERWMLDQFTHDSGE